jgi:erythromycin esterase-like protein
MAHAFQVLNELYGRDAPAFVWAHNTHIARAQHRVEGYYHGGKAMGTFLAEELGDRYVSIGQIGYQVSIDWPGVHVGALDPAAATHVEGQLHELGRSFLLVTLGESPTPFLAPGSQFLQGERMVPGEQFDLAVFFDEVPAMRPL